MTPSGSQTVGPFFNFGLTANSSLGVLTSDEGERIRLRFRVTDGDGAPTPGDSMIEIWQADAHGRYRHELDPRGSESDFGGFGRLETDADGVCTFETVKPGRVGAQAPHVNVVVFARGLLRHLYTRLYFAGDAANDSDTALKSVPAGRRSTLLAQQVESDLWHMEIRLQGEGETVFFEL